MDDAPVHKGSLSDTALVVLARMEERWERGLAEVKLDVREVQHTLQGLVERLDNRHEKLEARVRSLESRSAWLTGALATVAVIWPFIVKYIHFP